MARSSDVPPSRSTGQLGCCARLRSPKNGAEKGWDTGSPPRRSSWPGNAASVTSTCSRRPRVTSFLASVLPQFRGASSIRRWRNPRSCAVRARPAPSRCAPRSVLKSRLLRKTLHRLLLLGAELLRQRDVRFYIHVAVPSVLLYPVPGNAKLLPVLRAGRNPQDDTLVVQRLDLDPRAEECLREVDRDDADEIQPFAPEEAIGGDVNLHDEIAPPLWSLILETQTRAFFDAGRDVDVDPLFDAHFAGTLTGGTALRGHGALAAADRARAIHGESTLTERDRAPPFALGTRVDRRALRRPRPTACRTDLGHHERDRHRPALRGDTERNRDLRLDFLSFGVAPARSP